MRRLAGPLLQLEAAAAAAEGATNEARPALKVEKEMQVQGAVQDAEARVNR